MVLTEALKKGNKIPTSQKSRVGFLLLTVFRPSHYLVHLIYSSKPNQYNPDRIRIL